MNISDSLKIGTIQFRIREIHSFKEFSKHVTKFVELAARQKIDLLVFPELFTLELLSIENVNETSEIPKVLVKYYENYLNLFSKLAEKFRLSILAGTTATKRNGKYFNTAHLFLPNQKIIKYDKIHLHYIDKVLGFSHGSTPIVAELEFGKVGLAICYDIGFPELARILTLKGAFILLVPSAAPSKSAWEWLRYCCHARAIENQSIVVHSCLIGKFEEMKFEGKSAIIASTDYEKNGIIVESRYDEENLVAGEIDLGKFWKIRKKTKAPVLRDLRPDVYKQLCEVKWKLQTEYI